MGTDCPGSEGGEQGDWTQSHVKGQRAASPQGAGSTYKGPGDGEGCRGGGCTRRGGHAGKTQADRTDSAPSAVDWTEARLSLPPFPPGGTSALSWQLWAADSQHPALTSAFQTPHAASKVSEGGTRAPESRDCLDLTLPACCPSLAG